MEKITYQREMPVYAEGEIIVVGGGPAGVAAAVMAARQKKRVILLEQSGTLGGSSSLCMVAELMNFDDGEHFVSRGFGQEVFDRLGLRITEKRAWFNVRYEALKRVYDDMVTEAGVDVLFYTRLCDVLKENGRISHAILSGPSGPCAIQGDFFIDATGTGLLSSLAGAAYAYGDEEGRTMSATICSLWGGIDFSRKPLDWLNYEKAYADGIFSQYDKVLPGIKRNYPEVGVGGGNVGHCFGVDDRDIRSLSRAMLEGRRILSEYETYYKGYVPGCENAVLIKSADFIGIREGRRVICEYTLTMDSFFKQESFDDEIGRYSYPVDIHPMTPDKTGMAGFSKAISLRHEDGKTYSIPYRCLVPKGVDNLLVAGRCIGTDRAMQASTRVIPCCYITGQAAGIAAAVCVENNTPAREADVAAIQTRLPS